MENAIETVDRLTTGFVASLPTIAIALIVIALFALMAVWVRATVSRMVEGRKRRNLGRALGRLASVTIIFTGLLVGVSIVAPSVGAAELLQLLGVGSVAIGFAFRDILQNFLAGILLLLREPFRQGDRVIYEGYEGVVEEITTRSTLISTYDGNRVIVPNGEIYTHPLTVLTAFPKIRTQYDFGIGYENDLDDAMDVIKTAVASTDGVLKDPAPIVQIAELGSSAVHIRALWWTGNTVAPDILSDVLRSVIMATESANISMPFPTQVVISRSTEELAGAGIPAD